MLLNIIRRSKGVVLAIFLLLGVVFILIKILTVNTDLSLNFDDSQADLSHDVVRETTTLSNISIL